MFCIFSKFELHRKKNQFVLAWCTQSNLCHRCVASLSHGTKSYSLLNLKTTHLDVSFFLQYITGRILVAYWSRAMVKKSKDWKFCSMQACFQCNKLFANHLSSLTHGQSRQVFYFVYQSVKCTLYSLVKC